MLFRSVILPLPAAGPDGELNTPLSERRHHLKEVLDGLRPGQLVCAGMADGRLKELADAQGLTLRDYFAREELAVLNAVPVALAVWQRRGKGSECPGGRVPLGHLFSLNRLVQPVHLAKLLLQSA